jgi:hypothetical protein
VASGRMLCRGPHRGCRRARRHDDGRCDLLQTPLTRSGDRRHAEAEHFDEAGCCDLDVVDPATNQCAYTLGWRLAPTDLVDYSAGSGAFAR